MTKRSLTVIGDCAKLWGLIWIAHCSVGCSNSKPLREKDDKIVRYVDAGRIALDEGDTRNATQEFHSALLRAWAMDDPYESGTAAYNFAACLVKLEKVGEASDWLVDSRVELCRARSSTGNTWLLSAEIARTSERYEDAERFICYAAAAECPCEMDAAYQLNGPEAVFCDEDCKASLISKIPGVRKIVQNKRKLDDCRQGYAAQIELARARLAATQCDCVAANQHFRKATELSAGICDLALQADRHDVAAMIFDLELNFLQAGAHRDREVELLRLSGQYSGIPMVLDAAAESYQRAERFELAIDRIVRSARIWLSRGELDRAWRRVQDASQIAQSWSCEACEIRMALTARLIEEAISHRAKAPQASRKVDLDETVAAPYAPQQSSI